MKKIVAASLVALAAAAAVATVGDLAFAGDSEPTKPSAAVSAPATTSASAPLDLAEAHLSYRKEGDTVTATREGTKVATLTLTSARYAETSATVQFTVDAERAVEIDPRMFIVWDAESGENSATATAPVSMDTGRHTLSLTFADLPSQGQAIGWAPSDGEAVWER